jgi:hypothetical protein
MALDIRLEHITIDSDGLKKIYHIRAKFIALDDILKSMFDDASNNDGAACRAVALARTANEQACQYAMKALCILCEKHTLTTEQLPSNTHGI